MNILNYHGNENKATIPIIEYIYRGLNDKY